MKVDTKSTTESQPIVSLTQNFSFKSEIQLHFLYETEYGYIH